MFSHGPESKSSQKKVTAMFKRIFIGMLAAACICCLSGCVIQLPAPDSTPAPSESQSTEGGNTSGNLTSTASLPESDSGSGQTQTSSSGQEISREQAFSIALENAGVSQSDARNVKIERDGHNGVPIYDIEFDTSYGNYDYEVAISDGSIIDSDYEVLEEWAYRQPDNPVSEEQVKILVQQKVPGAPASEIRVWQENDDGRSRWEGSLSYNGIYYEFEIDTQTGIITDWNADRRG